MSETSRFLEVALAAVKKAEPIFVENFGNTAGIKVKDGVVPTLVSDADKDIEVVLREELVRNFPLHSVVGEEGAQRKNNSPYTWYLDPIDGTTNFIRGFSPCVISVGFFDEQGPLVGVISSPQTGVTYSAIRGGGAFKNGKRIHVSITDNSNMLVGAFGWKGVEYGTNIFKNSLSLCRTLRVFGSDASQLAMVAEGSLDCFTTNITEMWDVAAGILLVLEAGGQVTDWDGHQFPSSSRQIAATNGKVHGEFLKKLGAV